MKAGINQNSPIKTRRAKNRGIELGSPAQRNQALSGRARPPPPLRPHCVQSACCTHDGARNFFWHPARSMKAPVQCFRGQIPEAATLRSARKTQCPLGTLDARFRRSAPTLGPRGCLADTAFFAAVLAAKYIWKDDPCIPGHV